MRPLGRAVSAAERSPATSGEADAKRVTGEAARPAPSDARRQLDRATSEADFQRLVTETAELLGWNWMHVRSTTDTNGRTRTPTSCVGWPDLVLWKPGRFLAVELKSERGRPSVDQKHVLESLRAAGIDVGIWRPSSWPEIESTLRGGKLTEVW